MNEETKKNEEKVQKEEPVQKEEKSEPRQSTNTQESKPPSSKEVHFDTVLTSKLGSLMPDTTEVVDVDDVLSYNDNFTISDKSHLVPFVIYMDAQFRQVVKTKRRNAMLMLLVKIMGITLLAGALVYSGSRLLN